MMIIIATIIGGLMTVAIVLPFLQTGKMEEFTQSEPVQLETHAALEHPPVGLATKLQEQARVLGSQDEANMELTYTVAELNDAIRSYEEFSELQGTFAVKSITAEAMEVDISFPLNTNPFRKEEKGRFLNGTLSGVPAIKNDELIYKVTAGDSLTGQPIPQGFLNHLQEYRVMQPYTDHDPIGRVMFGCESVSLGEGMLTLVINPTKYADQASIAPAKDHSAKKNKRRTIMPALSFLMVGALFIFMVKRRNAKEGQKWKERASNIDE